jgi:DNA-binding FadR family transcriptional regulator
MARSAVDLSGKGDRERRMVIPRNFRRTPKTSEVLARDIARYIIDNDLPEGSMLPIEKGMIESLGVGRTTLREALRLLETRGILMIRAGPKGGPVVRRPVAEHLGEALTLILQFEGASLADVMHARNALEPMLAELAARRISEDELNELDASVVAILSNLENQDVFLTENHRFHTIVARAAGSVVLRVFMETLKSIADGTTVGVEYSPGRKKAVAQAHEALINRLRARDPIGSRRAMQDHLDAAARYWEQKYPDLFGRPVRWIV